MTDTERLTNWVIHKIKTEYPDDVALLVYVPADKSREQWGAKTGARRFYAERNEDIRRKYRHGVRIDALAEEYSLSDETIRKILYRG